MANEELEPYRAEFTAFCEHMEVGLKTRFPSLTQKEVLAVIGISLFAETQKLQRDNAALMEDAAAQIQIAREAAIRADAWRDFATHQTWCADCAESVASCPIGIRLQTIALEMERPC